MNDQTPCQECASKINALVALIQQFRSESEEDRRTILRLESQYGVQYDRAEELLKERDDARRNYCYYVAADRSVLDPSNPDFMPYCEKSSAPKIAKEMGWNQLNF